MKKKNILALQLVYDLLWEKDRMSRDGQETLEKLIATLESRWISSPNVEEKKNV